MKDFIAFASSIAAVMIIVIGIIFGVGYLNERWNCNSYVEEPTKLMGGTCYVQQPNQKWVTLSSFVKATNVEFNETSKQN